MFEEDRGPRVTGKDMTFPFPGTFDRFLKQWLVAEDVVPGWMTAAAAAAEEEAVAARQALSKPGTKIHKEAYMLRETNNGIQFVDP